MRVVDQRVIVAGIATGPFQRDLVGVARVAVDERGVRLDHGVVSDAQRTVGIAGVDHRLAGIDAAAGVDLVQTVRGHLDGHDTFTGGGGVVGDSKLAVSLGPGRDLGGAGRVLEELQHHVALLVGDALGERVHESVVRQIGGSGGNTRQRADDLVLDHIPRRGGAGMSVSVRDAGGAAVLAGVGLGLAQRLFQAGDAGQVLGIERDVINPAGTAVVGVGAVGSGHGNRDEEGGRGLRDHFRDFGLHKQIQTEGKLGGDGVAVCVGRGHSRTAAVDHIVFQRVLYHRGVGGQRVLEAVDQYVGAEIVHGFAVDLLIRRSVAVIRADADCAQKGVVLRVGDNAVQELHMLLAVFRHGVDFEIGHLEIAELHALQRVPVGVAIGIERRDTAGAAEDGFDAVYVLYAGGDIGAVPHAVLLGVGEVILIDADGTGAGHVDNGLLNRGRPCRDREAAYHHQGKQQREKSFHLQFSFLFVKMIVMSAAMNSMAKGR